jgi:hypothetical protein
VSVTKIESATDDNGTGSQKQALAAMKVKVPLYTVRFREQPGTSSGYTLWSFVYVDGGSDSSARCSSEPLHRIDRTIRRTGNAAAAAEPH